MAHTHAFMSYATEDELLAHEVVGGLKAHGFQVWYAKLSLKVGQILLDEINKGLTNSAAGILLISKAYLAKGWTNYEMDALVTQHIETKKKLLPVWHGVSKDDVVARHVGLAGVFAISSTLGVRALVEKLSDSLAELAPTRAVTPIYSSPRWRFLQGDGELTVGPGGPAFTIWDAIVRMTESEYPIWIDGQLYSRNDLLLRAAERIAGDIVWVRNIIGKETLKKVTAACKAAGFDPKKMA